jgi:hypothetical protein
MDPIVAGARLANHRRNDEELLDLATSSNAALGRAAGHAASRSAW